MPKENRHSRGRREEKKLKRKREQGEDDPQESKRQKSDEPEQEVEFIGLNNSEVTEDGEEGGSVERPFYGMLEDEEQEYFRRADELLELNDFPSPEERDLFLANVYREAEGKELKIVCSQSCSRLMERLILLSSVEQKKKLFDKFSGNFAHLVQHRFASHCCETLFIQSAPIVTQELTADSKNGEDIEMKEGEVYVSMENLFLYTLNELEGQMTFLLTDRFASHTLRVLLVVLSGRALEMASTRSLLQSKKKEKIGINGILTTPTQFSLTKRAVPESFHDAVEKIISDTIATMDQSFIRVLATHPTGNPSLQLLLELELTDPSSKKGSNSSDRTIISALLPDDISIEGSESSTFINGILYDPIGSRLLETIMTYAPGKLFKQIYRSTFRDRIAALARNEISSYVVIRVLERISKEDLEDAVKNILPQITGLIERSRTVVVKTLLERCHARGAEKSLEALTNAVAAAYGNDPSTLVLKMACIDDVDSFVSTLLPNPTTSEVAETPAQPPKPTPSQTHGSLVAQSMLSLPGAPATLLQTSLLTLQPRILLGLSLYNTTSHIIQAALTPSPSPSPTSTSISTPEPSTSFRRKLLNTLLFPSSSPPPSQPPALTLALSPTGSHTLDSVLLSSLPLFSLIERTAIVLSTHEAVLRESFTGRIVWRNWIMDLFKRRRGEWVRRVKERAAITATGGSLGSVPGVVEGEVVDGRKGKKGEFKEAGKNEKNGKHGKQKSGIELAREKFAMQKARKEMMTNNKRTGANKISA